MSYDGDQMRALTYALRDTEALKYALREFNGNIDELKNLAVSFNRLAAALEKQNSLEEMKLGLTESKTRR